MSFRFKLIVFFFSCCFTNRVFAQSVGNSPYSVMGVGDLYSPGFIPNTAMGGVGVSNGSGAYMNNINPALLSRTKIVFFEAGLFLQSKGLTEGERTQQVRSGTLNYLALAFPVSSRWTMGITLAPYSRVEYTSKASSLLFRGITDFNIVNYTYRGTGGISKASFVNGFDLIRTYSDSTVRRNIKQLLSIGIETAFLFGNITKESLSQTNAGAGTYDVAFEERINYSDFVFKPGLAFRQKVRNNVYLNVGATHTIAANVKSRRMTVLQQRSGALEPNYDTLENRATGQVFLPAQTQFGLSLESPFRWSIAADVSYQPWSQYKSFDFNGGLADTYRYSVGGEFTPNLNSVDSYFKRITYRLGFNHSDTPYLVNGQKIVDQSISFGFSLPMMNPVSMERGRAYSDMNMGFVLGQRGAKSPIQEQYFKIFIGFTLRDNGWFQRRRVD
jgi:long-subunit fatty acid transport protein